jgi:hypothetical protein
MAPVPCILGLTSEKRNMDITSGIPRVESLFFFELPFAVGFVEFEEFAPTYLAKTGLPPTN